ncbi:ABC transporter substrate-binding protein [Nonomuraea sp. NPDC048916]|uniref:ABC transporter substrate-binding protein n=1 Tax=Nonomuraea sp. NPDC048916 TaxID=3154232 RepID=UPI0033C7CB48
MKSNSASRDADHLRSRRWRLAAAALVPLLLAACGGGGQADGGGAAAPYHLGVLVDLTGSYAALGEAEKASTAAFAEKVNAAGGINGRELKLTVVDGRSSESDAVSGVRKLAGDGALAVIGPSGTSASIAIKPVTAGLKIPAIGMASGTAIVEPINEATWMFKNFPDITRSTRAMLSFTKSLGAKSVAVLAPNNAYGQQQSKAVPTLAAEYGLTMAGSELHDPDATDFVPQLTRLKSADPDSVIVFGVVPGSAVVAQNAKQIGFDAEFVYEPGSASPDFIKVGKDAVEGRYVVGTKALVSDSVAEDDPQYQAVKDFTAAYGAEPTQFAGNGWDAISLITEAIKKTNPDPSNLEAARTAIRDALENDLGGLALVNGVYRYSPTDHSGLGTEGLALLQVRDGAFRLAGRLSESGEVVLNQE